MGRAVSVLFYTVLAFITCVMAANVKPAVAETDAYYDRRDAINRVYIVGIFFLLFLVSSLRFGIGNDYTQYTLTAHEAYVGGYVVTEAGFNFLVRVIYTLFHGEYYEIVFALFAAVTLFLFLRGFYRDSADFSQSFVRFMTLGLYCQTFNTMRDYLALSGAFCSRR